MQAPQRLKKSLRKLDEIQQVTDYALHGKPICFEFRKYISELKAELEYLSVEKKQHRIKFAKKVMNNNFVKNMKFWTRFKLGLRFIFLGEL